ncbi:MAG: putative solute-binding protein [Pseudomonadota bacterium]
MSILRKYLATVLLCLLATPSLANQGVVTRYFCVFDPVGRTGDIYTTARDIATDFLPLGVRLQLYPYSTESAAKADFRSGLCDAVILTGFAAREYNTFTTTAEAWGGLYDFESAWLLLSTLTRPELAPLFMQDGYEVASIFPAGGLYAIMADKEWTSPEDVQGKPTFAVRDEPTGEAFAEAVGVNRVYGDTTNFAAKYVRNNVDVTFSPSAVIPALELDRAMEMRGGGLIDMPMAFLTLQIIIRPENFPEGFGQAAREQSLSYYERIHELVTKAERKIDPYRIDLTEAEADRWQGIAEGVRDDLAAQGIYDARMLKLLKRIRCHVSPERGECQ